MAENADLIRSLLEAWNRRDFDYASERTAPDAVLVDIGSGATYRGREGGRQYNTAWADAFPDGQITIDRIIEAGDVVVAEYTGRGTHTGPLVTPGGTIPATGRTLTLHLCDVTEIKDGMVVKQHAYFDSGSLLAQLGLMAQAPTAATQ
jgi:steroid delta-isomerase-like uncharacterized protein